MRCVELAKARGGGIVELRMKRQAADTRLIGRVKIGKHLANVDDERRRRNLRRGVEGVDGPSLIDHVGQPGRSTRRQILEAWFVVEFRGIGDADDLFQLDRPERAGNAGGNRILGAQRGT